MLLPEHLFLCHAGVLRRERAAHGRGCGGPLPRQVAPRGRGRYQQVGCHPKPRSDRSADATHAAGVTDRN